MKALLIFILGIIITIPKVVLQVFMTIAALFIGLFTLPYDYLAKRQRKCFMYFQANVPVAETFSESVKVWRKHLVRCIQERNGSGYAYSELADYNDKWHRVVEYKIEYSNRCWKRGFCREHLPQV